MADLIDRTATAVRVPRDDERVWAPAHQLVTADTTNIGRCYHATCGRVFYAAFGAVLSTHPVSCPDCLGI